MHAPIVSQIWDLFHPYIAKCLSRRELKVARTVNPWRSSVMGSSQEGKGCRELFLPVDLPCGTGTPFAGETILEDKKAKP